MTILLLCLAVIIAALVWRALRVSPRHRWRRWQARIMGDALCGPDGSQRPAPIYARLRAMDAPAFEEMLLQSFERGGHRIGRNHRYRGDGGIDVQLLINGYVWLIQAKRYAGAFRPKHVQTFAAPRAGRGASGLFIHTGRTGGACREVGVRRGRVEIVSGQRLLRLVTDAPLMIGGRTL